MLYNRFSASVSTALFIATFFATASAFAQGFDNYVAPQTDRPLQANGAPARLDVPQTAEQTSAAATKSAQSAVPQARATNNAQGGYIAEDKVKSAIVQPPADYKPSEEETQKLDEFLTRWEEYGKDIKRVACSVHMREFDGALQQDAKRPVAHTWGEFRFITPNKLSYHVKGEFEYTDAKPEGTWKEGKNEWQVVLDGKSLVQYDFQNKKAVVYKIPEDEQDIDLTMDNGQFPLFFVAKADALKDRFYLRIVTPEKKRKSEVWIEAFPRYARDAQQFKSITVLLSLKDLQPTYMRKMGANGKSKTDLTFEKVAVNKGAWNIEGSVDQSWTKEVRDEQFSLLDQKTIVAENGTTATLVTDPAKFPSAKKQPRQTASSNPVANRAKTAAAPQRNVGTRR
ncbi:MAG: hypothetical protein IJM30_00235 [Thermoguttaceae bacterium]|nr:hypothetical protein [Thermoguttaceae bacterium]